MIQILSIDTKGKFRAMNMCELGYGKFYQQKDFLQDRVAEHAENKQDKLSVWKGFKLSISNIGKTLMMQIDVCCRVLRTINFLETMNGHTKDEIIGQYTGALVVARYGKHKIYKIEEIDYGMGPKDTFMDESKGKKVTYEEYYKENYGLKVTNMKQPLIKVEIKKEKEIKNGKLVDKPKYGYLVPEFVSLTGMEDHHRTNFRLMKEVAEHTKMTPGQR
jgi:aubergine